MGEFLAKLVGVIVVGVIALFVLFTGGLTWLADNMVPDWTPESIQEAYQQGPESKHWKMLQASLENARASQDQCQRSAESGKHTSDEAQCAVAGRTLRAWTEWKAANPG